MAPSPGLLLLFLEPHPPTAVVLLKAAWNGPPRHHLQEGTTTAGVVTSHKYSYDNLATCQTWVPLRSAITKRPVGLMKIGSQHLDKKLESPLRWPLLITVFVDLFIADIWIVLINNATLSAHRAVVFIVLNGDLWLRLDEDSWFADLRNRPNDEPTCGWNWKLAMA